MARPKPDPKPSTRADALRSAVDQAFQAAAEQGGRFRDALEDVRPATGEELKAVRRKLAALERRVSALEKSKSS